MELYLREAKAIGIGLSNRLVYAFFLAAVSFGLWVFPLGLHLDFAGVVARVLNLPVALAGLALPLELRGLDTWFHRSAVDPGNPTGTLVRHLRNAIPVYVLLFYVPNLLRAGRGWRQRRRAADGQPSAAAAKS